MTNTIQIYADTIKAEQDGDGLLVTVSGINVDQLVSEFSVEEILDCIDFDKLAEYYIEVAKDNE